MEQVPSVGTFRFRCRCLSGCSASCSQRWFGSRVAFLQRDCSHIDPQPFSSPGARPVLRAVTGFGRSVSPAPGAAAAATGDARARRTKDTLGTRHNNSPGVPQPPPSGRVPRCPPLSLSAQSARPSLGLAAPWPPREGQRGTRLRPALPEGAAFPPCDRGWSRPDGRSGRARGADGTKPRRGRGCAAGVAGCRRRGGRCGRAASGAG